ncbi:MAG: GGDEF domain-containing protein [Clostridiales bacterium]|nr:GGDEF domain-containing protein [Clostridiales bacterium]
MFDLYTAVILVTILLLITTTADIVTNRLITKGTKIKSVITCLLIGMAALGECVGVLTNGAPVSFILLHKMAKVIEFSTAPAIGVAAAMAYGDVKKPRLVISLCVVHALFECVAMCFGWVFRVDSQNIYHREELYLIYVVAFVLSIILCFISIIRNGKAYQIGMDIVLIWTLILLAVGIGIQFIFSNVRIDFLCIAVGNMLFYSRYYKIMLQVDAVTGLLNRRCYEVNLTDMESCAVILLFDVDQFKQVNDVYGHLVGDICLQNVAKQLRDVYGKYGVCYRVGGDEFCVILNEKIEKTEELTARFISAIKRLQESDNRMPTVSMGYAYYDASVSHIQNVIEEADAMLYRNKKVEIEVV